MTLQSDLPDPLADPHGYNAKYPRVTDFNTRLASVGKTLAAQKYDDACASYDALAKEYGVDLAAQGVRPLSAIEAEAKHPPKGGCDLAESSRRSMWLTESFQKKAQAEHLSRDDSTLRRANRAGRAADAAGSGQSLCSDRQHREAIRFQAVDAGGQASLEATRRARCNAAATTNCGILQRTDSRS
jgi:hypothetical protein